MRKCMLVVAALMIVSIAPQAGFAAASSVDALIEKLVEKGVLTRNEGIALKAEIAEDEKIFMKEGVGENLPKWVKDIKLKGDVRLRFQKERRADDTEPRKRGRIRYRLGIEGKVNDQVKVGAGLASGNSDPRSTNQTFQDSFSSKGINLDYVFIEYEPIEGVSIIGGKFPRRNYLWQATDVFWDSDINPEGGSVHFERKLSDVLTAFANSGIWIIDENGKTDRTDPFLFFGQIGAKFKSKESPFDFTIAGVKYAFNGLQGINPDNSASGNTRVGGVLVKDYDALGVDAELGLANPFGLTQIERVAVFGNIIKNLDFEQDRLGFAGGIKFGDKRVAARGNWQFKYQYAWLEADSWPDFLPDSDRLGGATNVKGHEWIFEYGLGKNVVLGFDAYISDVLKGAKNPETLLQTDIVVKF